MLTIISMLKKTCYVILKELRVNIIQSDSVIGRQGLTTNERQGRVLAITRKNHPIFEKMLTFNADEYAYSLELKYLV